VNWKNVLKLEKLPPKRQRKLKNKLPKRLNRLLKTLPRLLKLRKKPTLLNTVKTEEILFKPNVKLDLLTLINSAELTELTTAKRNTAAKKLRRARLIPIMLSLLLEEFNPSELLELNSSSLIWKVTLKRSKFLLLLNFTLVVTSP